ncbi:MAG: hypothetical protein LBH43_00175 [Treponema sp.]|nr:hypothetical protein [Treponema sp.]
MSLFRNFTLVIFSLFAGIGTAVLFLWGVSSQPGVSFTGETWGILSFDEGEDDRLIGEALSDGGFGIFHSESSQVFYIDNFDGLKEAALDRLGDVFEPYDPRNDGYAEKLRFLFVRDGRRYFYLPIANSRYKNLEHALDNLSYELTLLGNRKNHIPDLVIGAASLFTAFILGREKRRFAFQLPLLLAFVWPGSYGGPSGLVLAGILTGIRGILRDLWAEFFLRSKPGLNLSLERLKPYRLHFIFAFFLAVFYGLICAFGTIPILPAVSGFFLFFLLEFFVLKAERDRMPRIRFAAVWMLPQKAKVPSFRQPMIPFAAASLAFFLVPFFSPGISSVKGEVVFAIDDYVSPADYEKHLAFQLSFSQTPLAYGGGPILDYYIDEDGLIAAGPGYSSAGYLSNGYSSGLYSTQGPFSDGIEKTPPFPLENFRDFLVEYTEGVKKVPVIPIEWISVVLLTLICLSGIYRYWNEYSGKKKEAFIFDRRAAA